jgi:hypothetical protein
MRDKRHLSRDTYQYGNYFYIDGHFEPKKGIVERYGSNPCCEIVLEPQKLNKRKLLLLV